MGIAKIYLESLPKEKALNLDVEIFNKEIGVGINITDAEIENCVDAYFLSKNDEFNSLRHTVDKNSYKEEISK